VEITAKVSSLKQARSRSKVRLRTGLALQLLALIGVGLLLLGTFVVRQTRADLVRQVDNGLEAALRGRLRDNQLGDRPTPPNAPRENVGAQGRTGPAPIQPSTNPGQPDPQRPLGVNPQTAGAKSIVGAPQTPLAGEAPNSPTQELPPTATVIFDQADNQLSALGSGSAGMADPLPKIDPKRARATTGKSSTVEAVDGSMQFRALAGTLRDGRLLVEAAPLRLVDAAVRDLIRTLTIGSLVVMGLAGLALSVLLRRALRPLGRIVTDAAVVAMGNTAHGVAIKTPYRELDQLSTALNAMVTKLGGALDGQREALQTQAIATEKLRAFVADASHELQTPVTSIRGWAELYRRGGLAGQEALNAAMSRIENEASRMGRLVDDLLVLARADEQHVQRKQPVDLALVCADAVEAALAIAPDRSVSLTLEPLVGTSKPFVVEGDPDQLRQVMDNLLANIRTHTPPTAETFVHIENAEATVVVSVRDNGGGFAPDQLAHAFDRFWRADQSNRQSHGLGLAIVQAIVTAHGGTVTAANVEPELPASKSAKQQGIVRGAIITVAIPSC
jgi:two-component system, OmpR family, sensor kinase